MGTNEVRVLLPDGNPLYIWDHFDGMQGSDIYDILKQDGYRGHLVVHGTPRRLHPRKPVASSSVFTFVEEEAKDELWSRKHAEIRTPSQLANSVSCMVKVLGVPEPAYDMGRTSASVLPLPLANESFTCYLRHRVVDAAAWKFVDDVMLMSNFFDHERQRQNAFADMLLRYLRACLPAVTFTLTQSPVVKVEALIGGEWVLVLLAEIKAELGLGGEPSVQAMGYFADHFIARRKEYHWTFITSCCPVFVVEVAGPNIRIGGAALFNKPTHEPFTPYMHIHRFLQDRQHLDRLSQALAGIGAGVGSLVEFYSTLRKQANDGVSVRDPTVSWPQIIRDEYARGASVTQFWRPKIVAGQLLGKEKQLLFSLRRPDGSKRIIKLCQRYGAEVHARWEALGYAPPFTSKQLEADWLVVDMEQYTEADGWRPLTALDPGLTDHTAAPTESINMYRLDAPGWDKCRAAVKSAYTHLHDAWPDDVHGDLRKQNIVYHVTSGRVAFVDFDWAGTDGRDLYPLFINPFVAWPLGVGSCSVMRCLHDVALLNAELALDL